MNVLVIAPHPDDESIGCGGMIKLHTARGDRVVVACLTSGELGLKHLPAEQAWNVRESEARRACAILGVADVHFLRGPDWSLGERVPQMAELLGRVVAKESPASILLPHPDDDHPDHRASLPILRAALSGIDVGPTPPTILGYEVWTPMPAHDVVEDITKVMADKLLAIRCHASQLAGFRYDHATRGLNRYRGVLAARSRYAEVFCQI